MFFLCVRVFLVLKSQQLTEKACDSLSYRKTANQQQSRNKETDIFRLHCYQEQSYKRP